MKKKIIVYSFVISLIYVSLGTIVGVVSYPDYAILGFDYNSPLWIPLVIITLPVNILLFGLLVVSNSIESILILQSIVFLICWFSLYKLILYYFKIKNKKGK